MAKEHKPNYIRRRQRFVLLVFILIQAFYILAELAMGVILLPGKRGGIMLTGIPVIMIASCSIALCLASIATIIDHYDKRPNEHRYKLFNEYCFKTAFGLFLLAPILQLLNSIFLIFGVHLLPDVHGFAEQYTFYRPEFKEYLYLLNPVIDREPTFFLISLPALAIGLIIDKYFKFGNERVAALFLSIGGFGIFSVMLVETIRSFLLGEAHGYRSVSYYAETDPAKFNAVLLTEFSLFTLLVIGSMCGIVLAILNPPGYRQGLRTQNKIVKRPTKPTEKIKAKKSKE